MRLVEHESGEPLDTDLAVALDRARAGLEALAAQAAELETSLPERVSDALREGMRQEVLPVARTLAELRGLTAQAIGRLERLETTLESERRARVEDLGLLVDLTASGWRSAERRLDRLERSLDRMERHLERRGEPAPGLRPV
jgi:hypothetical protein